MEAGWKSGVAQPSHGGVGAAPRGRGGRGWRRPGAGCVGLPGLCVCSLFLRNVYRRITSGRSRGFVCDGVNGWFPGALCRKGCSFGRMSRTVSEVIRGGAAAAARAATSGGAGRSEQGRRIGFSLRLFRRCGAAGGGRCVSGRGCLPCMAACGWPGETFFRKKSAEAGR